MTAFRSVADACAHHRPYSSLPPIPFCPAQSLYSHPALQPSAFHRSHLTSCPQFGPSPDLAATMAANQDEGDLETFQRLSDNYQTQAQVRSMTGAPECFCEN